MNANRREPIISNEIPLCLTIWYMSFGIWVNIPFRKAKIYHVDCLFVLAQPNDAVTELDIAVKDAPGMHEFQSRYLSYQLRIQRYPLDQLYTE